MAEPEAELCRRFIWSPEKWSSLASRPFLRRSWARVSGSRSGVRGSELARSVIPSCRTCPRPDCGKSARGRLSVRGFLRFAAWQRNSTSWEPPRPRSQVKVFGGADVKLRRAVPTRPDRGQTQFRSRDPDTGGRGIRGRRLQHRQHVCGRKIRFNTGNGEVRLVRLICNGALRSDWSLADNQNARLGYERKKNPRADCRRLRGGSPISQRRSLSRPADRGDRHCIRPVCGSRAHQPAGARRDHARHRDAAHGWADVSQADHEPASDSGGDLFEPRGRGRAEHAAGHSNSARWTSSPNPDSAPGNFWKIRGSSSATQSRLLPRPGCEPSRHRIPCSRN